MTVFRILLAAIFVTLLIYTSVTIAEHGWNFLPIFFADIAAMGWPGQFNTDFMFMLTLSGLWLAWRHGFSGTGFVLWLLVGIGGALFLSLYLLIVSFRARDVREIVLGRHA